MKTISKFIVHPEIGNERRAEVYKWCTDQWGDYHEYEGDDWKWFPTSNYERSYDGSFDIHFQDIRLAHLFIIAWGGYVAETVTEYGDTGYTNSFDSLFESA